MLERRLFRQPKPGAPVVIAVFSYRYDAHLVPDLITNIQPFVDGYVAWDDRAATQEFSSEPERRSRLLAEAIKMGATWILPADPDERIEDALAQRMPDLLAQGDDILWTFDACEMFTPDHYRIDGMWNDKSRLRLFPAAAVKRDLTASLHGEWIADHEGFRKRRARINFYHFRMATPERRRLRRELYATADPTRQNQAIGYDYLDDERGMVLQAIPQGRGFSPPYHEDHGLWSPDPGKLGDIVPDPLQARLAFVGRSIREGGQAQASHVLQDLALANPGDTDLLPMAAMLSFTAGDMPRTQALASAALSRAPDAALALFLRGKAAAALGDPQGLQADFARLQALTGNSLLSRDLQATISRAEEDFTLPDAQWRRWVTGPATCHQGNRIVPAPMSVVVIGYQSPKEIAAAVASLRAQDTACEIVVVNSGGGDVEKILTPHLDHIRLITTDQPLFVGAARNIGIDASRGGLVGFLAADCQALPGWVSGRLREHGQGARSVSNPVVPEPGASALDVAALRLRYGARSPNTGLAEVSHFGRSYTREILSLVGSFPPGLQVSEDGVLNRRVDRIAACVWAPDVLTTHKEPGSLWSQLGDSFRRGMRMVSHEPFSSMQAGPRWILDSLSVLMTRFGVGERLLLADDSLDQKQKRRILRQQWLVLGAQYLGVLRGLARKMAADRAERTAVQKNRQKSQGEAALASIRTAVAMDPQNWQKAQLLGEILVRQRKDGTAAFRAALALDPTKSRPLRGLLAPILARADWAAALRVAETAARDAPQTPGHWQVAAGLAARAGYPALAIAYAQRFLSLNPHQPAAHAWIEDLYRKNGDPGAAATRRASADLIQADQDRKAHGKR